MEAIKRFVKTTLIGGVVVLLPVGIAAFIVSWIWDKVTELIRPLSMYLLAYPMGRALGPEAYAAISTTTRILVDLAAVAIIIAACFLVGLLVRTGVGRLLHGTLEKRVLKHAPGYSLIKETVSQFLGRKESPFASVALVRLYGNETLVTAFVTEKHPGGRVTVFVPTGPNPTSGNIFHIPAENCYPVSEPVEDVMRSVISCGAGSTRLLEAVKQQDGSEEIPPAPPEDND